MVAADLFYLKGTDYLVIVDYFSRYSEVHKLGSTTAESVVINTLKATFARHGIPEILRSDNGPQSRSKEFAEFATKCKFKHTTSSSLFLSSNGQEERRVKTVKHLLKKTSDLSLHYTLVQGHSVAMVWKVTS